MTEQNWEYCELRLTSQDEYIRKGPFSFDRDLSFNCFIRYYAFDGDSINIQLSETGKILSYNPFAKAMAFLGANGWEAVSIQIGNAYGGSTSHDQDVLVWGNRIALLKRPIMPNRKINEPELKL